MDFKRGRNWKWLAGNCDYCRKVPDQTTPVARKSIPENKKIAGDLSQQNSQEFHRNDRAILKSAVQPTILQESWLLVHRYLYRVTILLNDDPRRLLAVKGKTLGRKMLEQMATIVTPDTILRWHRELVARN